VVLLPQTLRIEVVDDVNVETGAAGCDRAVRGADLQPEAVSIDEGKGLLDSTQ
jgi:hypothetical protein